jgi:type IV pilus assembly protein PilN
MGARQEQTLFLFVIILVCIGVFYWHNSTARKIRDLRTQINQAEQEIQRLSKIVEEVEKFKADKKILEGKIAVIDELKTHRQVQVHYLDELNKALPGQVWLEYYQQKGQALVLRGKSLSTDDVADFMRKLDASEYFDDIKVDQISQRDVSLGDRTLKINDFSMRLKVVPGGSAG